VGRCFAENRYPLRKKTSSRSVVTQGINFSAHAQVRVQEIHQSEKHQEFINTRLKPTQTANFSVSALVLFQSVLIKLSTDIFK
jgi:hypothetical protein